MSRDRRCKTKCCQLVARSECLSTLTSFIHSLPTLCQRREKIATIFHSCCYWSPFAAINWHSQFAIRESQSRVKPKLNKLKLQFRLSGKLYWTDSHDAFGQMVSIWFHCVLSSISVLVVAFSVVEAFKSFTECSRGGRKNAETHSALIGTCSVSWAIVVLVAVLGLETLWKWPKHFRIG